MSDHRQRKEDHLDLCATSKVAFREKSTLFDEVELIHQPLPEMSLEEADPSTRICGKILDLPLVISAMTGGVERANRINRELAEVAEKYNIGLGFGSMRPLLENGREAGYRVRDIAPNILLFGNIGVIQARDADNQKIIDMVLDTGCDALCVHLNPAQELAQVGGDRDFRGGLETIQQLVEAAPFPIVAKETGCGIGRRTALSLKSAGVEWLDISGAGGTSWVGVEALRGDEKTAIDDPYWDWGIPTAASLAQVSDLGLGVIATGGIRHGLDIIRSVALGARAGGMARPFLQAWMNEGQAGVESLIQRLGHQVRTGMLLTGSKSLGELSQQPVFIGESLKPWIPDGSSLSDRRPRLFS